jgi:hypothetical protein
MNLVVASLNRFYLRFQCDLERFCTSRGLKLSDVYQKSFRWTDSEITSIKGPHEIWCARAVCHSNVYGSVPQTWDVNSPHNAQEVIASFVTYNAHHRIFAWVLAPPLFFFITLGTGPRRVLSLELSDAKVCDPPRARLM